MQEQNINSVLTQEQISQFQGLFGFLIAGDSPFLQLDENGLIQFQNEASSTVGKLKMQEEWFVSWQTYFRQYWALKDKPHGLTEFWVESSNAGKLLVLLFEIPASNFYVVLARKAKDVHSEEYLNQLLAEVLKKSSHFKLITDAAGKVEWVNDSFLNFLGYSLQELVGRKPGEFLQGPLSDTEEIAKLSEQIKQGGPIDATVLNYKKNGETFVVQLKGDSIHNELGEITHFFADEYDITELHRTQNRIARNSKFIEVVMDSFVNGILVEDANRKILRANKKFCEIFGIQASSASLHGQDCATAAQFSKSLFVDEDGFIHFINEAVQNRVLKRRHELELKDGRVLSITYIPIEYENQYAGCCWKYNDITDRKKNEQLLIEAKNNAEELAKSKQMFLANMSHEIRTPMNAVMGLSALLENTPLNEEQSEYVKAIKTSAENLLVGINDILDNSKLDVNKLKIEKTPFNFQNFVRQIEILLGFKAREKGLNFHIHVKEGVPEFLLGDHFRLNQVLINVIGNAIKFTEKGSVSMTIAAVPKNKQEYSIEIEVADTGIGIEEKNLKHIFDSFNQENASIARRFGGTGLGLNISKRLTELMGGTLLMHSKKGFGTKVEIHVPMEVSSNPDYLLTQTTDKEIDIAGKRILIVEDNDFNRLLASTILQKSKVIVDIAKDGLEALVACEENEYDLILMDIQMPILDGHEASDLLRVFKVKTPIIGLSAHPSGEEWNICLEHGMNDYLSKPFKEQELKEKIERNLKANKLSNKYQVPSLYNLSYVEQITKGNEAFLTRILHTFKEELGKSMQEMKLAAAEKDLTKLKFVVNKIRPTINNFSVYRLAQEMNAISEWKEEGSFGSDLETKVRVVEAIMIQLIKQFGEKLNS